MRVLGAAQVVLGVWLALGSTGIFEGVGLAQPRPRVKWLQQAQR
jgi:hypothetical protein